MQEFKGLSDSSTIYKLLGPVLLKQDKNEAVMAVDGRLDYITKEMYVLSLHLFSGFYCLTYVLIVNYRNRVEDQIKEIQEKSEHKKMEVSIIPQYLFELITNTCQIYQLQTQLQGQEEQVPPTA